MNYFEIVAQPPGHPAAEVEWPERAVRNRIYARLGPGYRGLGWPPFETPPQISLDRHEAAPHPIRMYGDFWLISGEVKNIIEQADPEAGQFVECSVVYPDSKARTGVYWLYCVTRVLDALDESASDVQIEIKDVHPIVADAPVQYWNTEDRKWKSYYFGAHLTFKQDVVKSAHLFRLEYRTSDVFVSEVLCSMLKDAGLTKGVRVKAQSRMNASFEELEGAKI